MFLGMEKSARFGYEQFPSLRLPSHLQLHCRGRSFPLLLRTMPPIVYNYKKRRGICCSLNRRACDPFNKRRPSLVCCSRANVSDSKSEEEEFDDVVKIQETHTLSPALTLREAQDTLRLAIACLKSSPPSLDSGILRFQVPLPQDTKALDWLQCQTRSFRSLPRGYFSPKCYDYSTQGTLVGVSNNCTGKVNQATFKGVASLGSAILFRGSNPFSLKDWRSIKRFLSADSPFIRAYGCICFNPYTSRSSEWSEFGSFYFFIPQIELDEADECSLLAATLAWDNHPLLNFQDSLKKLELLLEEISPVAKNLGSKVNLKSINKIHHPERSSWDSFIDNILMKEENLLKIVLARRTGIVTETMIDSLDLVANLQENEGFNFQFHIEPTNSLAFIGSTPQFVFRRDDMLVTYDIFSGFNTQQHFEDSNKWVLRGNFVQSKGSYHFDTTVQEVKADMKLICKGDIAEEKLEDFHTRLTCRLKSETDEFYLLSLLHLSPLICGYPHEAAMRLISMSESFDRGMSGGFVGWLGGDHSNFSLATGSALVQNGKMSQILVYSEAELVKDNLYLGWQQIESKTRKYERLLDSYVDLQTFPNMNALWAHLIVEECCRLGVTYFCIAPGSRSSALAVAAGSNINAKCVSCFDERSLAFHALGYAKGCKKPAVIITSSGTAVSNLLPAVVEAKEDCIPLLLLTADRPPELHDSGANQTINQVNHFGSFARYFFNLPPPDDRIPAKMVLTTIDNAIYQATHEPIGPVHINCGFREPLSGVSCEWKSDCLKGLSRWNLKRDPFTKYITQSGRSQSLCNQYKDVIDLIKRSSRGLLIVGSLKTYEEMWAALSLAQHLHWPVVADILSGLRLRKEPVVKDRLISGLCFIDMIDHVLVEDTARDWISPDVVIQVGSKLTSKQLHPFLEDCNLEACILVDDHPFRHDPLHILTHRIQDSVVEFVSLVKRFYTPRENVEWCKFLGTLNALVDWEVSFQLNAEPRLSEPYVSQAMTESLSSEVALFVGNSMPVRDTNMYGKGWSSIPHVCAASFFDFFPFSLIRVGGNRGASGIDGLLSTAVGFAVGSNQQTVCAIGDISFLHDTNGLSLLTERMERPALTILVTNNHGGSIFSLLPSSKTTPTSIFKKFFSTPHDVSLRNLCAAHSVKHVTVHTQEELRDALYAFQCRRFDQVIEIDSQIEENATFHRVLMQSVRREISHFFKLASIYCPSYSLKFPQLNVLKIEYVYYRIPLTCPPTTSSGKHQNQGTYREGFLLLLNLDNGAKGYGEVAPIGLEKETLLDVEEQLRFLIQRARKMSLDTFISLLNDSFQRWIWKDIGIPVCSLFPSVRCGLEMAVLTALAATQECNIGDLLLGISKLQKLTSNPSLTDYNYENVTTKIQVCALVDDSGDPDKVAGHVERLVKEGFRSIKLKVACRHEPMEDVAVIQAIRNKVGNSIEIRADANRKWSFDEAMQFAVGVKNLNLRYLEEPIMVASDLPKFCNASGLCVALDESIQEVADCPMDKLPLEKLSMFIHPKIVAVIIKPSRVGGFERAALIAKWANKHGMITVISAAFESGVSLSAYAQFAYYINCKNNEAVSSRKNVETWVTSHGFGTFSWLHDDVMTRKLHFQEYKEGAGIQVDIEDAAAILQNMELNPDTVKTRKCETRIESYTKIVHHMDYSYSFHILDTGEFSEIGNRKSGVLLFLHGFLGSGKDWIPVMQALSVSVRCVSVDLPGHGMTQVLKREDVKEESNIGKDKVVDSKFSFEVISEALAQLISSIVNEKVVLVGYSMGARISLFMSLKKKNLVSGSVLISGSPGIQDAYMRRIRSSRDAALAESLLATGLKNFVMSWYKRKMWATLRDHPFFEDLRQSRILSHNNIHDLAKALASLSVGRQPSLWNELPDNDTPLLLIVGDKDIKFKKISQQMCSCQEGRKEDDKTIMLLEVHDAGHAVHIENPLPVIHAIREFLFNQSRTS